jgi:microsomal dipeptidase-like Zn-dependent dipeptidase/photosystem II stability/assembly factor-like uncharacterized protein
MVWLRLTAAILVAGAATCATASNPVVDGHTHQGLAADEDGIDISGLDDLKARGFQVVAHAMPVDRTPTEDLAARISAEVEWLRRVSTEGTGFAVADDPARLMSGVNDSAIQVFFAIEWFESVFGAGPAAVERYRDLGVRVIGFVEEDPDGLFDSTDPEVLSPFGREIVAGLNDAGILIDITHLSDRQMLEVIARSSEPVIASHSNARAVVPTRSNLSDEVLTALAENGGSVWVSFNSSGVLDDGEDDGRGIDRLIDHIDVLVEILGTDHVGIGTDLQAGGRYVPASLNRNDSLELIQVRLTARGYSAEEVDGILGGNILRALAPSHSQGPRGPSFRGSWEVLERGTEASLRGLSVVDNDVAWASGSGGTFLRSIDGGRTWRAGTVPGAEDLDFRDVHAWDEQRAVLLAAGLPAMIYRTVDGGATWNVTYSNQTPGVFFNAMEFSNDSDGVAVSDPVDGRFLLIFTADAGETWRELPWENRPAALEGEAGFAASGSCLAVHRDGAIWFGTGGSAARVHRSGDWGATWEVADTPLRFGESSQGVFSLHFGSALEGSAVGGDYRDEANPAGSASITRDGGATWVAATRAVSGFRECVVTVSDSEPQTLMAVGPSGTDISEDGGTTWSRVGSNGFHAVAFSPDGPTGIAVGADGAVARWRFKDVRGR